jgi:hypothetical protein
MDGVVTGGARHWSRGLPEFNWRPDNEATSEDDQAVFDAGAPSRLKLCIRSRSQSSRTGISRLAARGAFEWSVGLPRGVWSQPTQNS